MSWTIHHGNALAILPTLPADSVDAVIADPPYNSGGRTHRPPVSQEVAMSRGWEGSDRSARLPPNWGEIQPRILRRDGYQCQIGYGGCEGSATTVDHINAGDDHRDANLQAACVWCHGKKSSAEGNAARQRVSMRRKPERHPGYR